ncbi:TonB family protein [Microbulbifer sp. ZKSA002]|uniref:TonB family protein n=1 Tax=Microbulbifer sp. ZKSA002 TaxID=3243388 RepID=UPI00403A58A9
MKSIPITFILTISLVSGFASATIIYVRPNYPLEALKNCIEGWVEFEVTVMPGSFFENVKIIDSYPEGVFDEAARKALMKYKLVPKELIGVTAPVHGVKRKISYNLDGECIQK